MLLAGIQPEPELDPGLKHSGVTLLGCTVALPTIPGGPGTVFFKEVKIWFEYRSGNFARSWR
jgi:hypothetical protein